MCIYRDIFNWNPLQSSYLMTMITHKCNGICYLCPCCFVKLHHSPHCRWLSPGSQRRSDWPQTRGVPVYKHSCLWRNLSGYRSRWKVLSLGKKEMSRKEYQISIFFSYDKSQERLKKESRGSYTEVNRKTDYQRYQLHFKNTRDYGKSLLLWKQGDSVIPSEKPVSFFLFGNSKFIKSF